MSKAVFTSSDIFTKKSFEYVQHCVKVVWLQASEFLRDSEAAAPLYDNNEQFKERICVSLGIRNW